MGQPSATTTVGRTFVVGAYLVALALVGRPGWLALILGVLLALVGVAPIVLAPPSRRRSTGASSGTR